MPDSTPPGPPPHESRLLDDLAGAVVITDPHGVIVYVNAAAIRLFGWSREELVGASVLDRFTPPGRREEASAILERLAAGEAWTGKFELARKDGSTFPALVSDSPVFDENGSLRWLIGITTDVTDQMAAESHARRLERRLSEREKLSALGQLTGGVAHDLNNSMTAMRSLVTILRDRLETPAEAAENASDPFLEQLDDIIDSVAELTDHLMSLGRQQRLELTPVDFSRFVLEAGAMLRRILPETVELNTVAEPSVWIRGDVTHLRQVLVNLAFNARDAMDGRGALRLHLERTPSLRPSTEGRLDPARAALGWSVLTIADNGPGVPPDLRRRIFEPFFSTSSTGSGLGLSTALGVLEQHAGTVVLVERTGGGASFEIWLPLAEPPSPPSPDKRRGRNTAPELAGKRVLLVEDNESVRRTLALLLSRIGCVVSTASNGGEALELLDETDGAFDLLLSDIVMPGFSGSELARAVARRWPSIARILATGHAPGRDLGELVETGVARVVLRKPFSLEALLQALQVALAP